MTSAEFVTATKDESQKFIDRVSSEVMSFEEAYGRFVSSLTENLAEVGQTLTGEIPPLPKA
jgi:2-hydroxy-3-keto-5-methylthiopentenyl-1-phosphate phosphatase